MYTFLENEYFHIYTLLSSQKSWQMILDKFTRPIIRIHVYSRTFYILIFVMLYISGLTLLIRACHVHFIKQLHTVWLSKFIILQLEENPLLSVVFS